MPIDDEGSGATTNRELALDAAFRTFVRGERIDLQRLATDLGIDRTTLFRWVGGRDSILTNVITRLGLGTLANARADCEVTGPNRAAEVMALYTDRVIAADFFREYLKREGERALRLLTSKSGGFQGNMTQGIEDLLRADYDMDRLAHPISVESLAFLLIRIAESFIYTDLITGAEPDAGDARAAFLVFLG